MAHKNTQEYVTPVVGVREIESKEAAEDAPCDVDVERLGRERPAVFSSTWVEVAFVASMLGALAMAEFIISGFQVVLPNLVGPLNIPPESQTWPSSALTLVAGAFLFPLGRLADMYGGYFVFNGGMLWFILWTVTAGASQNFAMLVACRAMQGAGAAAFLPAGISLLGRTYRPGPRKNLVFGLYGAICPLGFFSGIMIGGVSQELLTWRWYFWLGGITASVCCIGAILTSPRDYEETRKMNVQMDWLGVLTTVPGMVLLIYAVTDSTNAPKGWASPQIIACLLLGLSFLAAAVYVEGWVATSPLIPADIFSVKYIKRMLTVLLLTWGVFAMYLYYSNFYIQLVLKRPALLSAVWFAPWAAGGLVLATISGLIMHILPGRVLLVLSGASKVVAMLLFALMPDNPNYWAWVMPAMLAEAACVDILWTVSNVFLTTSLPKHRQGVAGAVITITIFLGSAFFLAIADVAKGRFQDSGMDLKGQYKGIFWIGVVFSGIALVICFFMKLQQAECSLTVDEKMKMAAEAETDTKSISGRSETSDLTVVVSDDEALKIDRVNEPNGLAALSIGAQNKQAQRRFKDWRHTK